MTFHGGGNCSLCGSPHTTKLNCPLNRSAKHKNKTKHPNARRNVVFSSANKTVKIYKRFTKTEKNKLFLTKNQQKTLKTRGYKKRKNCPKNTFYDKAICPYQMKRCFNPKHKSCVSDKEMKSPSSLPALSPDASNIQAYKISKKGRRQAALNANKEWGIDH
jgi:hypothetical protein